jgi:antitoxin VapB
LIYITGDAMKTRKARVFWTGRSQAIRLPKEFRFETDTVLVHREGQAVVVEPADEWPEGYVESFAGVPDDFARPSQGEVEKRTSLG